MFDIIIKNGQIVDGSGSPAYTGDIAIKDGLIAKISSRIEDAAAEVIDAENLQVCPGFIDNHSHSDTSAFTGSSSYNYLEQGITTQIAGQCGESPAPYYDDGIDYITRGLTKEEFERRREISLTPASFMRAAEQQSFGTNYAFFVGQGSLRGNVMGFADGRANKDQMDVMKKNLVEALENGYIGFSSGLVYAPSVYADEDELTELAAVLKPYHGVYASHIRGEGNNVLRSVNEAIRIGENSGAEVLISHLKTMGRQNEGISRELLKAIDDANDRGVVVNADQYPYTASSAPLSSQIPPKYLVGGIPKLLEYIAVSENRDKIEFSIFNEVDEFESAIFSAGYDNTMITEANLTPDYVDKTVGGIAKAENKRPVDVLCEILIKNNGYVQGVYFNQNNLDLLKIMEHPRVFCGSDWSDYPDSKVDYEKRGSGHPRGTATMIRRLELVRDFRLRTMEESIRNLSYDTAHAMHLEGIGQLKEGWHADICICDYERLHANANFSHPYRAADGIHWVIVNGKIAVKDGRTTGVRSGKVLKHSGK